MKAVCEGVRHRCEGYVKTEAGNGRMCLQTKDLGKRHEIDSLPELPEGTNPADILI